MVVGAKMMVAVVAIGVGEVMVALAVGEGAWVGATLAAVAVVAVDRAKANLAEAEQAAEKVAAARVVEAAKVVKAAKEVAEKDPAAKAAVEKKESATKAVAEQAEKVVV